VQFVRHSGERGPWILPKPDSDVSAARSHPRQRSVAASHTDGVNHHVLSARAIDDVAGPTDAGESSWVSNGHIVLQKTSEKRRASLLKEIGLTPIGAIAR
jgi:hypothetical protein